MVDLDGKAEKVGRTHESPVAGGIPYGDDEVFQCALLQGIEGDFRCPSDVRCVVYPEHGGASRGRGVGCAAVGHFHAKLEEGCACFTDPGLCQLE